jgi:hypothetical protein
MPFTPAKAGSRPIWALNWMQLPNGLMAQKKTKAEQKIGKVMKEYKAGTLKSGKPSPGKGPTVKSRKQAIAIALSEAGKARKNKGKK